jgi:hypothetical protein
VTTRLLISIGLLVSLSAYVPATSAREIHQEASLIKAVFIYNFAKFTRWPKNSIKNRDSSLTICTIGKDKLADALQRLGGRTIHGRPVRIATHSIDSLSSDECHVLYIASSMQDHTYKIFELLMNTPILTISTIPGFSQSGGMVELKRRGEKIRFIINLQVARQAGLELSSRILDLATVISAKNRQ